MSKKGKMVAEFTNDTGKAVIKLYDYVGQWRGVNLKDVCKSIEELEENTPLDIYVNSYGGEVFEGFAIYNTLRMYKGHKTVHVMGIAASIASIIALAGDKVIMHDPSTFMIHNASTCAWGTADELEQSANALRKINETIIDVYEKKTKLSREEIIDYMNKETFFTPKECLEYGFANEIVEDEPEDDTDTINAYDMMKNSIDERIKNLKDIKNIESSFFVAQKSKKNVKSTLSFYLKEEK